MHSRVSSSIIEKGVARIVYNEQTNSLKGILLNAEDASFSIYGSVVNENGDANSLQKMRIVIVDDETGEKFHVEDVEVKLVNGESTTTTDTLANGNGNGTVNGNGHPKLEIETPAIKFRTEDVLIGNRADVEIRRFLDPSDPMMTPSNGRHVVHRGQMQLRVVAAPQQHSRLTSATRRTSITQADCCGGNGGGGVGDTVIEWAHNDFLV